MRWRPVRAAGFTLVEVAIVLLVLGVLAGAALAPVGERLEERRRESTWQRLDSVRRALIGHLATTGALPCPLPAGGLERSDESGSIPSTTPSMDDVRGARCARGVGRVPAATLGVAGPTDASGALLDDWGNVLQYAVSLVSSDRSGDPDWPDWTTPGELSRVGLQHLEATLVLCRTAVAAECPRAGRRADAIVFVVFSTGATIVPRDAEHENLDGDRTYAVAPRSPVMGQRFDDQLVWASRDELAYWLLRTDRAR